MEKKITESQLQEICHKVKSDLLVTTMQRSDLSESEKQLEVLKSLLRAIRRNLNFPEYMLGNVPTLITDPISPFDNIAETVRQLVENSDFHPKLIVEEFLGEVLGKDSDFDINWKS